MHCDICTHPPKGFDGSLYAQQAMGVCKEAGEMLNLGLVIDILRASGRKEIFHQNLHRLKYYGAGREISRLDWIQYLTQMINQGLLMIDYTQHSTLKLTSLSNYILLGHRKIKLTKPINYQKNQAPELKPLNKNETFDLNLMSQLKEWRRIQAAKEKVPAYIILNDKVLKEIVSERPTTLLDLINVPGIGDYKLEKYGKMLIEIVQDFIQKQNILKNIRGGSQLESFHLYKQGLSPQQIARERSIKTDQVYEHLIELYQKGEEVDIQQYISDHLLNEVIESWRLAKQSYNPAVIAEYLQTPYPLPKIKVALAIIRKRKIQ